MISAKATRYWVSISSRNNKTCQVNSNILYQYNMNLRALVSVTGKPGLFKLIGQNKGGFILESLDAQKVKSVVNLSTTKMATLEDITIYGDDEELKLSISSNASRKKVKHQLPNLTGQPYGNFSGKWPQATMRNAYTPPTSRRSSIGITSSKNYHFSTKNLNL